MISRGTRRYSVWHLRLLFTKQGMVMIAFPGEFAFTTEQNYVEAVMRDVIEDNGYYDPSKGFTVLQNIDLIEEQKLPDY